MKRFRLDRYLSGWGNSITGSLSPPRSWGVSWKSGCGEVSTGCDSCTCTGGSVFCGAAAAVLS